MRRGLLLWAVLSMVPLAHAQTAAPAPAGEQPATVEAMTEAETHRLKSLSAELRCLVCQNQSLADSNADLAIDLRDQVRDQIRAGKSDGDIKDYLVQRYGEFVLYRPRVSSLTWVLWAGPFLLLASGAAAMATYLRRRQRARAAADARPDDVRLARARALLQGDGVDAAPAEGNAPAPVIDAPAPPAVASTTERTP